MKHSCYTCWLISLVLPVLELSPGVQVKVWRVHRGMVRMRGDIMCALEQMKDGICCEVYIVSYSLEELKLLPDKTVEPGFLKILAYSKTFGDRCSVTYNYVSYLQRWFFSWRAEPFLDRLSGAPCERCL